MIAVSLTSVIHQESMAEKISATIEDYLGVMYILERDGEPVAGVRLAELLGVKPPTVTNTLKRMIRDDLITMDENHHAHFTHFGREAAYSVMRRHILAEWMLVRMLSWAKVHKEAHDLEHAMSAEVEAALLEDLDNPEVCPHGNPFPGHEAAVSHWISLMEAPPHTRLVVRRIHEFAEENQKVLAFLEENQISPGKEVQVEDQLAFNQTVNVRVGGRVVSLGFALARYVFAEEINSNQ
jgi:DtxR family transcriptional regulator, Mn-dependent transcriptional regulator